MTILVIDIGGTSVKFRTQDRELQKFPSGPTMTAAQMVEGVLRETTGWDFEAVSIGYPGPVVDGQALLEPKHLGPGWVGYDFKGHFGKPVQVINDAAMQAVGSYEGGRMLFLGLGTGLGSALIVEKMVVSLELAHLPYRKGRTFEDYVGLRGLNRLGRKKWRRVVADVTARLRAAVVADYVVIGGGNAKKLKKLPEGARLGANANAFLGGFRLWEDYHQG